MRLAILLTASLLTASHTQAPTDYRSLSQETLARGYWIDPSTSLMWPAQDNGSDIKWGQAAKYCRNLRLAGYSDWRLATIDELEGIYDGSENSSQPDREGRIYGLAGRAKGGLLLTGNNHWSSNEVKDDRGHSTGYEWVFDYPHGKRGKDQRGYHGSKRVLCVRHA